MSSTALTIYPHLPPTTNLLSSQQRMRLLRSTRKLGSVLGTTPYLLEHDTSFTFLPLGKTTSKASKRQGSIFTLNQPSSLSLVSSSTGSSHSPSPSTSSIDAPKVSPPPGLSGTLKGRPRDKPPHLCLQVNTTPVSFDSDSFLSLSPSPLPPLSPVTPVTPIPDPTETRRKRLAKLARHLGEKIPVDLVLTPEPALKPAPVSSDRPQRRRSQSVHVTRNELLRIRDDIPPLPKLKQEWVGEWNRSNIRDVQNELRNLRVR